MNAVPFRKMKLPGCITIPVLLAVVLTQAASAQFIEADVTVMLDRLPLEKQQELRYFSDKVTDYINTHAWTDEQFDEPVHVSIQIFLQDKSSNYESRYSGRFLITNNLDLQQFDKYWRFPYEEGNPLLHDEHVFNPLTSFINYYIYIVVGSEYDKMGKYLGTPFFEKAKQICEQAKFNSLYSYGWEERELRINEILSEANLSFRAMKDRLYLGYSYAGDVDSVARRYVGEAVDMLAEILTEHPGDEKALEFLQAHYIDIMDIFSYDNNILNTFIRIDPDHADTYRKYLNK
ncbi:DUF4835 family protein [bacterium]|nr:DUF4835 family protein [bacterium]